jgi:hypothetical protein
MSSDNNATNADWLNGWQRPEGAAPDGPQYPVIQWLNGGKGSGNPVLKTGGWELPVKWFYPLLGDAYPVFNVEHSGAETEDGAEPAYLFQTLHIAAVMKHVAYYRGLGQERVWAAEYQDGFYSRIKILGFVREIEALQSLTPVVLTFRSSVARDFGHIAKQFRAEVIDQADKLAAEMARAHGQEVPPKFLPYAFWFPVAAAGKRVKTGNGQQSPYAPMVSGWDSDPFKSGDRDQVIAGLKALATPPELRAYVYDSFYEEAKVWLQTEKDKLAGQSGEMMPVEAEEVPVEA